MIRINNKVEQVLCKRVRMYIKFDILHKKDPNTDEYKALRKESAEHPTHWKARGERPRATPGSLVFSMDTETLFKTMCEKEKAASERISSRCGEVLLHIHRSNLSKSSWMARHR